MGKLPGQLSGGQQQRVAIARAVVLEPSLVLMDEPLSNLDAKLRLEMRTEIRRLHQSLGLTTVYVTHDQEEALSMADRLVVLRAGQVEQVGTPEDLHTRPANWHVADFMGYRNLLRLKVAGVSAEAVVVEGSGLSLVATAVGAFTVGQPVVVGVRPEDLEVVDGTTPDGASGTTPDGAAGHAGARTANGASRIRAHVEVVEYQGRELAMEVRTADGVRLHVRTQQRLAPGDAVVLSVTTDHLRAFPDDSGDVGPGETDLGEAGAFRTGAMVGQAAP